VLGSSRSYFPYKRRKLEAELGASEQLHDEIRQLRGEIDKLVTARKELSVELASLMGELNKEQSVKQQLPLLKTELDGLQQELIHVRTASGLEQKGNLEIAGTKEGNGEEYAFCSTID
jgi:seryl-tRNA synthetase